MTTNCPADSEGRPLSLRSLGEGPLLTNNRDPNQRLARMVQRRVQAAIMNFAEAVREELHAAQDAAKAQGSEIAALKQRIEELERTLSLEQKFAQVTDRLDRIEARAAATPLRAAG